MITKPSFLVGAERSGTTVLRLMLAHHPQIAWSVEFLYSVELMPPDDGWPSLEAYYAYLATDRTFLGMGYTIDRSLDYPSLVDSFLRQCRDRAGKPLVGATVHYYFDRLLRIWPDARFIHLLRDGRDVARSSIGMGWAGNVWTGAQKWIEAEALWSALRGRLAPDRYIEVVYEQLVSHPEPELERICAFLGVPYDPAMLSYPEKTTYERPDAKLAYQWRRKLSEYEIRLAEARIGPMLLERGYELSGLPPLKVTPALHLRVRSQDWVARQRYRLKTFGPKLTALDIASRRLGLTRLQEQVRGRIHERINATIK
jgi:hypothetical protein